MGRSHAWRKQGTLVKRAIEENPIMGKRPLGRPGLRWEDGVNKEVERMEPGTKWRKAAEVSEICGIVYR